MNKILKLIVLSILSSKLLATGNCPNDEKICAYFYNVGLIRAIKIQNMTNKPIIFNLYGFLDGGTFQSIDIKKMKLKAFGDKTAIQLFYQDLELANRYKEIFYNISYEYRNYKKNERYNQYKMKHKIVKIGKHRIKVSKQMFEKTLR